MASHYEVISSEYVPLATVRKVLRKSGKTELTYEQKLALENAEEFTKINENEANKLVADLKALNMHKLKEDLIVKIVDIMPKNKDDLKLILNASKLSFKDDELDQIFEAVKKNL